MDLYVFKIEDETIGRFNWVKYFALEIQIFISSYKEQRTYYQGTGVKQLGVCVIFLFFQFCFIPR